MDELVVMKRTGARRNEEDSRDNDDYYRISIYNTTLGQIIIVNSTDVF